SCVVTPQPWGFPGSRRAIVGKLLDAPRLTRGQVPDLSLFQTRSPNWLGAVAPEPIFDPAGRDSSNSLLRRDRTGLSPVRWLSPKAKTAAKPPQRRAEKARTRTAGDCSP
ncbi:MAG: hypothetical protein ACO331_03640, partial [Prochlorothrix sp.]